MLGAAGADGGCCAFLCIFEEFWAAVPGLGVSVRGFRLCKIVQIFEFWADVPGWVFRGRPVFDWAILCKFSIFGRGRAGVPGGRGAAVWGVGAGAVGSLAVAAPMRDGGPSWNPLPVIR